MKKNGWPWFHSSIFKWDLMRIKVMITEDEIDVLSTSPHYFYRSDHWWFQFWCWGLKGLIWNSRFRKILNLKDCRHQNCWLLPFFNQLTVHFFSLPGGQLEKLMDDLHAELSTNPPLPGSYTARKGDLCAALFVDNNWYVSNPPPHPPRFFRCWSVCC